MTCKSSRCEREAKTTGYCCSLCFIDLGHTIGCNEREGERNRDAAVERADAGAPPLWRVKAHDAVKAMTGEFSTDDLWALLERAGGSTPSDPKAMGAVMQWAKAKALARPTGRWIPSVRPQCNRRPIRVWQRV